MKLKLNLIIIILNLALPTLSLSSPKTDLINFQEFFKTRFPKIKFEDYKDGIYALDKERRAAWQDWEDFAPPYTDGLELGKILFHKKFNNGNSYSSCFKRGGIGIRQFFPYFDQKSGNIITLEGAINDCRVKNGEQALSWGKGKLAAISAYMTYTSRGKRLNVHIPQDSRALAIYEQGKTHFYAKRGQLNFSCADCHIYNSGNMARGNLLSPALGHTTHFPVWRKKWAKKAETKGNNNSTRGFGTLHRRYNGCNKQVRSKPFKLQSEEYKALEFFHQYMSKGQIINGPGLRQ